MKQQLLILTAIFFLLSACQKNDDFDYNYDDDQTWTGDDDTGSDQGEEGSLTLYQVTGNDVSKIKDYNVSQDLLSFQQDYAKHLQMWDFVIRLLPIESRDKIEQFEVFHGGGDLLGYVIPVDEKDLSKWRFGLAIDAAGDLEGINFKDLFTYVTLHEYGHVLTLNNDQIQVNNSNTCDQYFTGEGCSLSNSYINRLYDLAWSDIYHELDENDPYHLYDKYPDRFVSDYAATNPGEDIAEVFAFFVTTEDRPAGNTIAEQKINLLYEFPELVDLRHDIRQNGGAVGLRAANLRADSRYQKFKICGRRCGY